MTEHGLTEQDLGAKAPSKGLAIGVKKVAVKYRNPVSGATWTGRGLKPKWLAMAIASGKTPQDFAIQQFFGRDVAASQLDEASEAQSADISNLAFEKTI